MGLLIVPVLILYFAVSLGLTVWTAIYAKRRGKNPWLWSIGVAFVMYNLVFWDWLPTVAVHKYYCSTEAGFWVYKTPEQWRVENPGVMEALMPYEQPRTQHDGDMENYTDTYILNPRFNWIVKQNGKFFPNLWRHEQEIVDVKTNEVLARYVDFSTSQERRQAGLSGWKFWLSRENCSDGDVHQSKLRQLRNMFMGGDK